MLEFTVVTLQLMREGKLYLLCNEKGNVFETIADVYNSLVLKFMVSYIEEGCNIRGLADLKQNMEKQIRSNLKNMIKEYHLVDKQKIA